MGDLFCELAAQNPPLTRLHIAVNDTNAYIINVYFLFGSQQTGAVFDKSHDERERVLRHAVHMANKNILRDSGIVLDTNIERVSYGNTYAVSKSVCSLLNVSRRDQMHTNEIRIINLYLSFRCVSV